MGRRKYASLIDLKAGYHNIPFEPESARYATFTCHRGKLRWLRMPFGLMNAPAHFQWVMETIVGNPTKRQLPAMILLDDTTVYGDDLDQCLVDGVEAILRLTEAGAMVG